MGKDAVRNRSIRRADTYWWRCFASLVFGQTAFEVVGETDVEVVVFERVEDVTVEERLC